MGLFGPESVTWRVHGDPSMLVGGLRAMLLQACHRRAMSAFLAHSGYRDDHWGRLQRTGDFVDAVTFGTTDEARRAGARVRGVHRRIPAVTDAVTGRSYRVDDPDLLLWVHCVEVESFLSTYRRCGGGLTDAEADTYVDEQRAAGALVGLDIASLPVTVAEIEDYYDSMRPELTVTTAALEAAVAGAVPPMPAWVQLATPARPLWAGVVALAGALLPRWARRLYGVPALPAADLTATVTGTALRTALLAVPEDLRRSPRERAARARLAA